MRIALVTDTFAPSVNGVAVFTASLARQLSRLGHEVALMAPAYPGYSVPDHNDGILEQRFHSYRLPFFREDEARLCAGPGAGREAEEFLRVFQPDVVHLQTHFFLARHVM